MVKMMNRDIVEISLFHPFLVLFLFRFCCCCCFFLFFTSVCLVVEVLSARFLMNTNDVINGFVLAQNVPHL